jgi:hypothetical protein
MTDTTNTTDRVHRAQTDPASPIEWLAHDLLNTADWRQAIAEEYPADDRNLPAATKLREVAAELQALPDDNSGVDRIDAAWIEICERGYELPALSDLVRSYGFGWGGHGRYWPGVTDVLDRVAGEYEHSLSMARSKGHLAKRS